MIEPVLPSHTAVAGELRRLLLGVDAEELHGSLCGYLSAGGSLPRGDWPTQLALDPVEPHHLAADRPLGELYAASVAQLDDAELSFALLLPEEAPVAQRAQSLVQWCRGFLGGYGLAEGQPTSADAREAIEDLARIAGSSLVFDDPEQDAVALEELVEFVRVAVLLLHGERAPPPQDGGSTLH